MMLLFAACAAPDGGDEEVAESTDEITAPSGTTAQPAPTLAQCTPAKLADVPASHPQAPELSCLASQCVIEGVPCASGRCFDPDAPVTRGAAARIAARAAGFEPIDPRKQTFADTPPSHWSHRHVEALAQRGIIEGVACGSARCFQPDEVADKSSIAKIIAGAANLPPANIAQAFADVPPSHHHYAFVQSMKAAGLVEGVACGSARCFRPSEPLSRAHTSRLVARAMFDLADCPAPRGKSIAIDSLKEDLVTNPAVVSNVRASNAHDGHWSFRWVMSQMAPVGMHPADFVEAWLGQFRVATAHNDAPQENGLPARVVGVSDRAGVATLLAGWPRVNGKLDLSRAPVELLAIVNRVDRGEDGPVVDGVRNTNGELRMVYRLVDSARRGRDMTVIMEMGLPGTSPRTLWAQRFHKLSSLDQSSEAYLSRLQAITDAVLTRGAGGAKRPNGSALAQLRTNEKVFGAKAQLREFRLVPDASGRSVLRLVTTKGTPASSFNGASALAQWLNRTSDELPFFREAPSHLAGGEALEETTSNGRTQWRASGVEARTLGEFAKFTCNGCHNGINPHDGVSMPLHLGGLYQVSPVADPGAAGCARISDFLKRDEMPRRRRDRARLLCADADPLRVTGSCTPDEKRGATTFTSAACGGRGTDE